MTKQPTSQFVREYFLSLIGTEKRFRYRTDLARFLGLQKTTATTLYNFLDGSKASYTLVFDWLDKLGARLSLPDQNAPLSQDVQFVAPHFVPAIEGAQPPEAEDYLAVPMVGEVGAGPGFLPQDEIQGYFLVHKYMQAVRYRRNLIAVQLGSHSDSMVPTLQPSDMVLVDRDDRNISVAGHIMLVLDPSDGSGKIKRVRVKDMENGDFKVMYWSDNSFMYEPEVYSLKRDFEGDWERCIVGRVIWAWTDVSNR